MADAQVYTFKHVHVISSRSLHGQEPAKEDELERLLQLIDNRWQISYAANPGEGKRLTDEAIHANADLIVVHGSDHLVAQVVVSLYLTTVPLLVLPNRDLPHVAQLSGVSQSLEVVLRKTCLGEGSIQWIDLGRVDERVFLQSVVIGQQLRAAQPATGSTPRASEDCQETFASYTLDLDGKEVSVQGAAISVINLHNLSTMTWPQLRSVNHTDGRLDVVVSSLPEPSQVILHQSVQRVSISMSTPSAVVIDGELLAANTPLEIEIVPKAVQVFIPHSK